MSEQNDRAKRLAEIARFRAWGPERRLPGEVAALWLWDEVTDADKALAALGIPDDGRSLAERITSAFEAAHAALDPVVARRDGVNDPPLALAVRAATAAKIALDLADERDALAAAAPARLLALRVDFRDEQAAAEITPEQAIAYLKAHGWSMDYGSSQKTVWRIGDGEDARYATVPGIIGADYGRRMLEVLRDVAEVEARSPLAVWAEMRS